MNNKKKKVCLTRNYIEHFLTLIFAVTGCISISAFASLADIPTGPMSSTIGLNIGTIIAKIKNYKSIIKKKKKKHDEIVLLAKTNICEIIARIKNYKSIIKKKEKKHDEIVLLKKA